MQLKIYQGNNYAYIDGANLHRGIASFGWALDYARFRIRIILSPHTKDLCSILLKRTGSPIAYLNDQRSILQVQKEKAPDADKTA